MKDVAVEVTEMTPRERVLYEGENEFEDVQLDKESLGETTSTGGRSKHQSMDFSGSVFLIASNGHVLSLPIPSESPSDPLNWIKTRRILVFVILLLYSSVALFAVQTPGILYSAFMSSFTKEVCHTCPLVLTQSKTHKIDIVFVGHETVHSGYSRLMPDIGIRHQFFHLDAAECGIWQTGQHGDRLRLAGLRCSGSWICTRLS